MRALICDRYEGIDALTVGEVPAPEPEDGQTLVEVEAASVNFADVLIVAGQYQLKPELPFVPGIEFAGTVRQTAGHGPWSPGDRVCGYGSVGALAEMVVCADSDMSALPASVPFDIGASIPVAYGTSYHALVDRGRLAPDETLLVLGAAGGVGMAAVQIGRMLGAKVVAAVSSDDKEEAARLAGAEEVIRYDLTSLRDGIAETTGGRGVDVVYDPVGGDATESALRSTRWNGRLLVIGFASGRIPEIPLNLNLVKGNSIVGVFWGRFNTEEPERSAANNRQIMQWVESGTLMPIIQKTFDLDHAPDALRWVAERKAIGRVVVTP
jgi:NADPH:quinone reductase